jgi:glucosamine-6-phosphate deaminase
MKIRIYSDKLIAAERAAADAARLISAALSARARARILVATGASQVEFLAALTRRPGLDWSRVEMFHLDEYVGLPPEHPASFRRYLLERFIRPAGVGEYHLLDGETDPEATCRSVGRLLAAAPVDVAFAGIGENGHLAFNDPPADFAAEEPYRVVRLDERCRSQQVGEGWFRSLAEVPERAISISVRQLLRARAILSVVPDARKAEAVARCLQGPVTPAAPASILQTHPDVTVYLDEPAAAGLRRASGKAVPEL